MGCGFIIYTSGEGFERRGGTVTDLTALWKQFFFVSCGLFSSSFVFLMRSVEYQDKFRWIFADVELSMARLKY